MRKTEKSVLAAALLLACAGFLRAQQTDDASRAVYKKTVDSVIAVRAMAPLGERSGSGVILTRDGLLLTSYAACPDGATNIRVWVKGPRLYTAEIVGTSKKDELTLLRIKPRGELKPVELGESRALRTGDASYTMGNAANSIILDDQPSFNVGIVSAVYHLGDERANSTYTGPVLETTAAVNVGMEGAPCLNADGKMVGFVTLNYSPHRFLGTAIPIDEIKPVIERLKKGATETVETPPAGEGWIGLRVQVTGDKLVVEQVEKDGPADQAGFGKGDVILKLGNDPVKSAAEFEKRIREMEAGSIVWIKADVAGKVETVKVTLEKKK
ncbi:MAG TPA: trypsin-like peptidase domain-containing protein [Planctomycetota bacterium]|nr:trypsin-like peptidase domain-containing protein [Planctomycetota bacterium]